MQRASWRILRAAEVAENPPSQKEWQDQQEAKKKANDLFLTEIEKGCSSTQAVFKKRLLLGWVLYVPDGGEHSIRFLFPDDRNKIKRAIERIGAGDDVPYVDLLRYLGEC